MGLEDRGLSILFTSNKGIAKLNKKCFGKDRPTNVISFSYLDGLPNEMLGDVIVSVEQAHKEAEAAGLPFYRRLLSLIIHGLVHVLGYDHELGPREARKMRYREKKLLNHAIQHAAYKKISL